MSSIFAVLVQCYSPAFKNGFHCYLCSLYVRELDYNSCEALHLQGYDRFTRKLVKPVGKTSDFSQLFMKVRV